MTEPVLFAAVVQDQDAGRLVHRLVEAGFGATRLEAYGGFLRHESSLVLVVTAEGDVPRLRALVDEVCHTRLVTRAPPPHDGSLGLAIDYEPERVEVGGAVVFELPIERMEYLGRG